MPKGKKGRKKKNHKVSITIQKLERKGRQSCHLPLRQFVLVAQRLTARFHSSQWQKKIPETVWQKTTSEPQCAIQRLCFICIDYQIKTHLKPRQAVSWCQTAKLTCCLQNLAISMYLYPYLYNVSQMIRISRSVQFYYCLHSGVPSFLNWCIVSLLWLSEWETWVQGAFHKISTGNMEFQTNSGMHH